MKCPCLERRAVSRYRLRFLLQELDLNGPEVVIGRSPECQITIEDPLVSRRHARITIDERGATVTDLGSRNGVRINGTPIKGEAPLKHNDRLRLGTQDLVFLAVDETSTRLSRATGFMAHCPACKRPYPGEAVSCPHCGFDVRGAEEDDHTYETITGISVEQQASWTFQLLGEVIERALSTGRASEGERMMQRAVREVQARVSMGQRLESKQLTMVTVFALRLARLTEQPKWAEWALTLHREHGMLPSAEVVDHLEALPPSVLESVRPLLSGFFLWWNASRGGSEDDLERDVSTRVRALAREA